MKLRLVIGSLVAGDLVINVALGFVVFWLFGAALRIGAYVWLLVGNGFDVQFTAWEWDWERNQLHRWTDDLSIPIAMGSLAGVVMTWISWREDDRWLPALWLLDDLLGCRVAAWCRREGDRLAARKIGKMLRDTRRDEDDAP